MHLIIHLSKRLICIESYRLTIHSSSYVYRNLVSLQTSMQDVNKFLIELSGARILFFSKTKIKNKLYNILHSLRAKNTQLLTSVTLELLSRAQKPESSESTSPPVSNTLEFDAGFAHYHGICRPKNFTLAVENFKEVSISFTHPRVLCEIQSIIFEARHSLNYAL